MNALLFVLLSSKEVQILKTVQIRPILYSSQPIRLQIFFRDSDKTVYYKIRQILLQNASGFLLQNVTFMTNCDSTHLFLITPLVGCLCKLLLIFARLNWFDTKSSILDFAAVLHPPLELLTHICCCSFNEPCNITKIEINSMLDQLRGKILQPKEVEDFEKNWKF